ncbi:hypothetical protein NS184_15310 [Curtobacterium luteum]|uniref:Uncharacterized protein n=2 Tax=Curtobacterium luteum TaxID=33881 RepID=A0A175RIW3_9MICO|nr:hypothetical protein NS184_15310 [Curtobacterium luteum]
MPAGQMQSMADALRRSVSCQDGDALLDDLAFWDAMRGYDCSAPSGPMFIRVYEHAASVPQTVEEWRDTFGAERTIARGTHWYVIGAPSDVAAVRAPGSDPAIADDVREPAALSPRQDYLTTCARYIASEGERYVRHPDRRSGSASQYETLFPGVTAQLHQAIDRFGAERLRAAIVQDRWPAALTPLGPGVKAQCALAYDEVQDSVAPLGGAS